MLINLLHLKTNQMKKKYLMSLMFLASASIVSSQNASNVKENMGEVVRVNRSGEVRILNETNNNVSIQRTSHLEEGFEGAFPPIGWEAIDNDGDGHNWRAYTPSPNTAVDPLSSQSAGSASWDSGDGALTPDNLLTTPQIHITSAGDLTFWVAAQDPNYSQEHYSVMLSTTGKDVADFTVTLHSETLPAGATGATWKQVTIPMGAYVGDSVYVTFRHHNTTDWFNIKIDDVICTVCEIVVPEYSLLLTGANYTRVWTNFDLESTIYPLEQAMANPLTFEAAMANGGSNDQTNVVMVSSVEMTGVATPVFTNTTPYGTLLAQQSDTMLTNAAFTADSVGTYNVSIYLESDSNTTSTVQKSFQVQDTVYARDMGTPDGAWEVGVKCGSLELSNLFDVYADQEATSISAYIHSVSAGGPGAEIRGHIYMYNTATQVFDLVQSTDYIGVPTTDKDSWKTLPLMQSLQLTAGGTYRVAIEGFQHNTDTVFIATSGTSADFTSHILDVNDCFGLGANTTYYVNSTPMIRLNVTAAAPNSIKDEVANQVNFTVYPNPNSGEFKLNMTDEKAGTYTISVSNLIGQQIYSERVAVTNGNMQKSINLSSFEKGIYVLSIADESSKAKSVRKIVTY